MSIIDISAIPAERLDLLDTATIFHGSHKGGGPVCQHCARELIHEIVTGEHRDATPPGCTALMAFLPRLNDGPWRDDAHRTMVMRPYLRKMMTLDPAHDEARIYAVIDHVYRTVIPDICDALKLDTHGSALRDMAPIVDQKTALAALAALAGIAALADRAALADLAARARADRAARAAIDALAYRAALAALAALAGIAALAARGARAAIDALDAIDAIAYRAYRADRDARAARARATRAARADSWEGDVIAVLDRVCAIP